MLGRAVVILVALLVLAPAARAAGPEATVRALDRQMRWAGAASGALVVDLGDRREVYARRPDAGRVPASVNKLFVTAAALLRLGGATTLETAVLADAPADAEGVVAGDLYLRGGGDPTFSSAALRALAEQLVLDDGLATLEGAVIGDESLFDDLRGPPSSAYRTSGYVGPLSALSLDRGRTGLRRPYFQPFPPLHAARSFARALKRVGLGGVTVRDARAAAAPAGARPLRSWTSPPVSELVRLANVPSDNFVAETLLKLLGARFATGGTTGEGARVVRATLAGLGLRPRIADGSGLSRANRTTPRQVVRLLDELARDPVVFDAFRSSLAVAGRTGTLHDRMRRSPARDRCRGKTGTLRSVSALAGYCQARSGRTLAFAILMNGVAPYGARRLQDRMLSALATYSPPAP